MKRDHIGSRVTASCPFARADEVLAAGSRAAAGFDRQIPVRVVRAGWLLSCVVVATGQPLMVCGECDSVWLNADEIVSTASPVQPHLVLPQISGPQAGILWDYVEPLGPGQPLSDWQQIKLAVDVANSPPGAEGS
ncbi:hypothetical protein AB0M54_12070 [Actinoplanes sp. NPDC051470]|uniref:hypothetical protein n=1 Tax=Actinoplanes sp. NPDC051470 TaxID=3157224 RepID=UPI003434A411